MNANTDLTGAPLPPEDSNTASITGATTQKPTTALLPNGSRRERHGALALTVGFGLVAVCLIGQIGRAHV